MFLIVTRQCNNILVLSTTFSVAIGTSESIIMISLLYQLAVSGQSQNP